LSISSGMLKKDKFIHSSIVLEEEEHGNYYEEE